MDLRKVKYNNCRLIEVDFTEANCQNIVFDTCDLSGAIFDHTDLQGSDFTSALSYRIDPTQNKIKGAHFSNNGIEGLLHNFQIKIS